ncbi:N-acetylmuramoyl-L-alanine amidase [Planctomycetota bacterium]|nr:N-acetylmuramoyl-L-alanine amidase [Planctomycetota bacterium]
MEFRPTIKQAATFTLSLTLIASAAHAVSYPKGVVWDEAHTSNLTRGRAYNSNYQVGQKNVIDSIAIHTTEGSYRSAINWFNNSAANASAHYVIGKDGSATQMVDSWDTAWTTNYINRRSISFEMAGYASDQYQWTYASDEADYGTTYKNYRPNLDKLAHISAYFVDLDTKVKNGVTYTYDIPIAHPTESAEAHYVWHPETEYIIDKKLDTKGFVGHSQITPHRKSDPGKYFPWDDFMLMVDSYVQHGENRYYDLSTIPEPTTASMIGLAGLALLARRRRKN